MNALSKKPRPSLTIKPRSSKEIVIQHSPYTSKSTMGTMKQSGFFFKDVQKRQLPLGRTYTMHKSQQFHTVKQNDLIQNIDDSIQILKRLKKGFNITSRFLIENQVIQIEKLLTCELKRVELKKQIHSEKMSKIIAQHQTQQLINRQKENIIHLQNCVRGRI